MSSRRTQEERLSVALPSPPQARARGRTLQSATVGAMPILNRFLGRMRLEEFLRAALPPEDRRTKLSPVKALLLLARNVLVSRAPIYLFLDSHFALQAAVYGRQSEIAKILVAAGAKVDGVSPSNDTPLMGAAGLGDVKMVQILLDAGANVHILDREGRSALWYAQGQQVEDLLRQHGLDYKERELTPEEKDRLDRTRKQAVIKRLRGVRSKNRQVLGQLLQDAITNDLPEEASYLIQRGADVNFREEMDNWSILAWAADRGYIEIARAALAAGADVNDELLFPGHGGTPLTYAAMRGHLEIVGLLVEADADVQVQGGAENVVGTPVELAAVHGHRDVVEYLLPLTTLDPPLTVDELMNRMRR